MLKLRGLGPKRAITITLLAFPFLVLYVLHLASLVPPRADAYHPEAAALVWARTLAFLKTRLESDPYFHAKINL